MVARWRFKFKVGIVYERHLAYTTVEHYLLEGDMEALALEAAVVLEATEGTEGVSGMDCPECLVRRDVLENIPCMGVH